MAATGAVVIDSALRSVLDDYHRHFALNSNRNCGACAAILVRIANLECPAAKHHRLRKIRAARLIDIDEFGPSYAIEELESDKCTACGFDFTGESK